MSLETPEEPPTTKRRRVQWHMERMWLFYAAARQHAVGADAVRAQWRNEIGSRRDTPDIKSADLQCDRDPEYRDHIGQQAMYDRWVMREAAVVSALIAAVRMKDSE